MMNVEPLCPIRLELRAQRARTFAPVARALLAGLGAGGDVHLSADGLALAGPAVDVGARVAVATAVAGVAADLDRLCGNAPPATLALSPQPVPIGSGESFVVHGLIRHGSARGGDLYSDLVERLACTVLSESSDVALTRGPVVAQFAVDDERFLAVLALVGDGAFVRRLGGPTGFLDALRDAAYRTFFRSWANPSGVEFLADAPGHDSTVVSTLPLLGASREDRRGYWSHLAGMLGSSALALFGTLNETYTRIAPEWGAMRAVVPDFGPRGDELHLQVFCTTERRYEATRVALLAQLVHACLGRLAACGATDGRLLSVDAWALAEDPALTPYVSPCCDEECLWAFAAYVPEPPSEDRLDPGAYDAVAQTARCVELALSRIERARWWSPKAGRLQPLPWVFVGTEPPTGRRFYAAGAVLDSVEVCRRWAEGDALRHAIEDEANAVAAHVVH